MTARSLSSLSRRFATRSALLVACLAGTQSLREKAKDEG